MSITRQPFGTMPDGREVSLYTMTNARGASVSCVNYGGLIYSIIVPDKDGKTDDVAVSPRTLEDMLKPDANYYNTLVGRYSNRIKNGKFTLNGKEYQLARNNNGQHTLHGGVSGFSMKYFDITPAPGCSCCGGADKLILKYTSPDGEEGFPGTLELTVEYSFDNENALGIKYFAACDQDTPVNLTNHLYFNLAGSASRDAMGNRMTIYADQVCECAEGLIMTGRLLDVAGTAYDLRQGKCLADGLKEGANDPQMIIGGGYDCNYCINPERRGGKCGEAYDPASGRVMEIFTDKPGIQLYTGNMMQTTVTGKSGEKLAKRQGYCLETQYYPDAVNIPEFESPVLKAGDTYEFFTVYKFSTR